MILLEYEAKALLRAYGLPVPRGEVVRTADEPPALPLPLMLKVQIPRGGRGKAGGVRRVEDAVDYARVAGELLGTEMLGCRVEALLAETCLVPERELYVALTVDRTARSLVLLAHRQGGVDIESAAGALLRLPLAVAPRAADVDRLRAYLALPEAAGDALATIAAGLYTLMLQEDALLVEVNPLMLLAGGRLVCADAKVELDDAAVFRHSGRQYETAPASSQFVVLDEQGGVASMANGAGLAMATVDAIQAAGASAANFLDVGGGTDTEGMVAAFGRMRELPAVTAIVVNIFGGITRCDEVAAAVVAARQRFDDLPPLYVRLTGTNEAAGRQMLAAAGVPVLPTLAACVAAAVAAPQGEPI